MLVHRYDLPDRFVSGTVGPPGERAFFLQARSGSRITSVALEKEQVAVLADRLADLLEQVGADDAADAVAAGADVDADAEPLDQPIEQEFRVGTMTLAWDETAEAVVIEAFAATDSEDDEAEEVLVVQLQPAMARGFAERAKLVVSSGRPTCQFCGQPMDPEGHVCPRSNGHKRLSLD
jgi:uncharacterized repeat protein (TIGR03847 family)